MTSVALEREDCTNEDTVNKVRISAEMVSKGGPIRRGRAMVLSSYSGRSGLVFEFLEAGECCVFSRDKFTIEFYVNNLRIVFRTE